jgi:putative nucleotidyltransferase with HDIG domain
MNDRLTKYVAALFFFFAALLPLLDWSPLLQIGRSDLAGLLTFIALGVLSQVLALDSEVGSNKPVKSSIAFLPLLALAVVYPPPFVILVAGLMAVVSEFVVRRDRDLVRSVFNVSQISLAYGVGSALYHSLQGYWGNSLYFSESTYVHTIQTFVAFYALAAVFFGLNILFVGAYISLRDGESFTRLISQTAGKGGGNLLLDLLASPTGLAAAYLYVNFYIGGLLLFVLPFLLVRHAYLTALGLHRSNKELDKANRDLLKVLIKAIETRDPYTSGHSQRVSTLAKLIAEDLGVAPDVVNDIERAALLHDIGKIDVQYSEIISKQSVLSENERAVIQTHATTGAVLLENLTSLSAEVIRGVRHHHEKFDGSGYPNGLAGQDIPVAARIIMLCDAVDAMLSDRPYRNALSMAAVRSELQRCAGTQFDPALVATVLGNNTLERAELLVTRSGARNSYRAAAM